jgi:hypothetical protein
MNRLLLVELRGLVDTRAARWLLVGVGLATAAVVAVALTVGPPDGRTATALLPLAQLPAVLLLPLLAVLAMTGEWSQRTALTTFALVPRRGRVLAAKVAAAVVLGVAGAAVTAGIAVLGGLLGDGAAVEPVLLAQSTVLMVVFVLMGAAFGALLQNTPLGIAGYILVPTAMSLVATLVPGFVPVAAWLDTALTTGPLSQSALTGQQWAQLGVSVALWVLVPLAAGVARTRLRDVA